jgi:hypothetical protein
MFRTDIQGASCWTIYTVYSKEMCTRVLSGDGQDGVKNFRQKEQYLMTNGRSGHHYTAVMPEEIHGTDDLTSSEHRIKTRKLCSMPSVTDVTVEGLGIFEVYACWLLRMLTDVPYNCH